MGSGCCSGKGCTAAKNPIGPEEDSKTVNKPDQVTETPTSDFSPGHESAAKTTSCQEPSCSSTEQLTKRCCASPIEENESGCCPSPSKEPVRSNYCALLVDSTSDSATSAMENKGGCTVMCEFDDGPACNSDRGSWFCTSSAGTECCNGMYSCHITWLVSDHDSPQRSASWP
jgi:hypothetical protein